MDLNTAVKEARILMGLQPLKPKQLEALVHLTEGKDTFVTLPTGCGKSIVFAVLPLVIDKML